MMGMNSNNRFDGMHHGAPRLVLWNITTARRQGRRWWEHGGYPLSPRIENQRETQPYQAPSIVSVRGLIRECVL